jgi:DNA-binding XRE family transcriptional regulator
VLSTQEFQSPYLMTDYRLPIHMSEDKFFKYAILDEEGCWIYTAAKYAHKGGTYPIIYDRTSQTNKQLSRAIYEAATGEELGYLFACHKCDKGACIKPSCLYAGTQKQNMQDAVKRNRIARGAKLKQTKLSIEDVKIIKQLLREKVLTKQQIALQFNVSRTTISFIYSGKNWRYVS